MLFIFIIITLAYKMRPANSCCGGDTSKVKDPQEAAEANSGNSLSLSVRELLEDKYN